MRTALLAAEAGLVLMAPLGDLTEVAAVVGMASIEAGGLVHIITVAEAVQVVVVVAITRLMGKATVALDLKVFKVVPLLLVLVKGPIWDLTMAVENFEIIEEEDVAKEEEGTVAAAEAVLVPVLVVASSLDNNNNKVNFIESLVIYTARRRIICMARPD